MEGFFMGSSLLMVFGILLLWSLAWKGWALWRAARNNHRYWFVALLLINTLGILEIIYIFFIGKKSKEAAPVTEPSTP
ncbi:MAG: DUF5652 family protein [Patescibacteria group bacterium]|mgnify:CR=1 FL=1